MSNMMRAADVGAGQWVTRPGYAGQHCVVDKGVFGSGDVILKYGGNDNYSTHGPNELIAVWPRHDPDVDLMDRACAAAWTAAHPNRPGWDDTTSLRPATAEKESFRRIVGAVIHEVQGG